MNLIEEEQSLGECYFFHFYFYVEFIWMIHDRMMGLTQEFWSRRKSTIEYLSNSNRSGECKWPLGPVNYASRSSLIHIHQNVRMCVCMCGMHRDDITFVKNCLDLVCDWRLMLLLLFIHRLIPNWKFLRISINNIEYSYADTI